VDDILKRLGNVEASVGELKVQVRVIAATITHLATAASMTEIKAAVVGVSSIIPYLATKEDVLSTKADVLSMETTIIKWIIATVLTSVGVAFAIARFVH
jgi:hypothetical protein